VTVLLHGVVEQRKDPGHDVVAAQRQGRRLRLLVEPVSGRRPGGGTPCRGGPAPAPGGAASATPTPARARRTTRRGVRTAAAGAAPSLGMEPARREMVLSSRSPPWQMAGESGRGRVLSGW
jgi:hypothetical protein